MTILPVLFLAFVALLLIRSFKCEGCDLQVDSTEPAFAIVSRARSFAKSTGMRIAVRTRATRNVTMMRLAFMKIANRLELDVPAALALDAMLSEVPYTLAPRDLPFGLGFARISWGDGGQKSRGNVYLGFHPIVRKQ